MAYGARLESVLGASPRGFESPILRHRTPGPLQVPGFLLFVACGAAGVPGTVGPGRCVCRWRSGRRARPLCVPVGGGPPASRPRCELRSARRLEAWPGHDAAQRCCRKFWVGQACGDVPCLVAAARVGRKRVCWGPVLRVTVSSEPPQGRNAARIRVRCRVRGGSLYMLLDHGRLQDAFLRCGSGHSS